MNPNHVFTQKAARAIAAANAESNRPRPRRRRVRPERVALSPQSTWGVTTSEYMGEGFRVSARP